MNKRNFNKKRQQKRPWKLWIAWTPIALTLVGCEPARDILSRFPGFEPPATEPNTPAKSPAAAKMEAEIRQRINDIRQQNNLNPLEHNESLAQVARDYSRQMAREDFFSHTSPSGSTPAQRVSAAGITYLMVGENLFRSTNVPNPISSSVKGWMDSPGHRENILRSAFNQTGIGIWQDGNRFYATQLFMRSLF
ncbi:CAP domain-containing protein [Chroococcidiopsidales cyanobacterium LEGE 13417]|nr:CAP domain-containing protein [Chroococcidiopsidales cyanobacterium LEGE 13417]